MVEYQFVALKVIGSNPIIYPKFTHTKLNIGLVIIF